MCRWVRVLLNAYQCNFQCTQPHRCIYSWMYATSSACNLDACILSGTYSKVLRARRLCRDILSTNQSCLRINIYWREDTIGISWTKVYRATRGGSFPSYSRVTDKAKRLLVNSLIRERSIKFVPCTWLRRMRDGNVVTAAWITRYRATTLIKSDLWSKYHGWEVYNRAGEETRPRFDSP